MLKKPLFTILFAGWVTVITVLSLFSFSGFDDDHGIKIEIPYADKMVHFIFYFFFVILGHRCLKAWSSRDVFDKKTLVFLVLVAIGYGLIIEILQHLMPFDREADIFDALANTAGAILAGWLTKTYRSRTQKLK